MPRRLDFEPQHSVARLDLSPAHSGIFTPGIEAIDLRDEEVRRFNALAQSLNEAMPPLSADQLAGVARRVLRTAAMGGESPFISRACAARPRCTRWPPIRRGRWPSCRRGASATCSPTSTIRAA